MRTSESMRSLDVCAPHFARLSTSHGTRSVEARVNWSSAPELEEADAVEHCRLHRSGGR
jgi:hypothetical protein